MSSSTQNKSCNETNNPYVIMHAPLNTNYSVADFHYLDLNTHIGRAQIREELEHGFQVPPEIIGWFFEEIDERTRAFKELQRRYQQDILLQ